MLVYQRVSPSHSQDVAANPICPSCGPRGPRGPCGPRGPRGSRAPRSHAQRRGEAGSARAAEGGGVANRPWQGSQMEEENQLVMDSLS